MAEAACLAERPLSVEEQRTLLEMVSDFMLENETLRSSYARVQDRFRELVATVEGNLGAVRAAIDEANAKADAAGILPSAKTGPCPRTGGWHTVDCPPSCR